MLIGNAISPFDLDIITIGGLVPPTGELIRISESVSQQVRITESGVTIIRITE